MPFPELEKTAEKLTEKRSFLERVFKQAGPDLDLSKIDLLDGDNDAKAAQIRTLNDELGEIAKQHDQLKSVARAAENFNDSRAEPAKKAVNLGQMFLDSPAYKQRTAVGGPSSNLDVTTKTLFSTITGWGPDTPRGPRVVDAPDTISNILSIVPQTETTQASVSYMEEKPYGNVAAEVAEGGLYPEAELGLAEKVSPVRKIGVWIPVTDEILEDVPRAKAYVNNRLPRMAIKRVAAQVLAGDGVGDNLQGILNTPGIQTQAKGTDPIPDAVHKALTKVSTAGDAYPDAVVMNPLDWQSVRLMKTADGVYLWGSPADPGPARIWGLQVTRENSVTAGTAIVGDFGMYSELAVRRGIDVQIRDTHGEMFTSGKQAIRADLRAAFVVYRPTAFCSVTGL